MTIAPADTDAVRPRICVVGAGAIGSVVAGLLATAGARVGVVARDARRAAIARDGLRYRLGERQQVAVSVTVDDPVGFGVQDVVVLAVKSQALPAALSAALPMIGPRTLVVPLVNGVPWWYFNGQSTRPRSHVETVDPGAKAQRLLPPECIVGSVVYITASLDGAGVAHAGAAPRLVLGEVLGGVGAGTRALAAQLQATGIDVVLSDDIRAALWSKMALNLATNPLSVVAEADLAELFQRADLRVVVDTVLEETLALARRYGVQPSMDLAQMIAAGLRAGRFETSMLQDYRAGRPLELGAIGEAVLELAAHVGQPMPMACGIVALAAYKARCIPAISTSPDSPSRSQAMNDQVINEPAQERPVLAASAAMPPPADATEAQLRRQLCDFYHLVDWLGWGELIFNHISVRIPGPEHHYLVNPFGLNYYEITPENLVKVGIDGQLVEASEYPANPAGFALHGAIHAARADVQCVAHTHTLPICGVAMKQAGFSHDNFYGAQLTDRIGYHDFERITLFDEERGRMLASLGDRHVLCLRNHGIAVCERDIPTTFMLLWIVQRAAEVQCQAGAIAGPDIALSEAVRRRCVDSARRMVENADAARLVYAATVRRMRHAQGR
ncbi:2-dehydropantoate 2-reductase [Stenotrophomonas sp. MMGLT7]|uniref:2-dehydropantoate 2-reductase n=1 Tax=Stenotrophomonas sp. MMGLT7 TaxID=2901227 RepID=UPI001E2E241F|nr:2-dehydropantoate 2-reductase [Stenotrophomonas sp. MMGLT7]MCD7098776.1 2-dehydropantoate 2-reductase [Stenotrophomonas sp. MMGLT7]